MASAARQRIEMRVDEQTKQMAERASAALGCNSLTEFMTRLIHDNAPSILQQQATIEMTNAQFDQFMAICESDTRKPSQKILDAARKLDSEGF